MNSSPENFEPLRKLLALKQHEQPPPGFFTHFSDKVVARLEAEGLTARLSWWQRLVLNLEAKPMLACAYGVMVGGLLVLAMDLSPTAEPEAGTAATLSAPWFATMPVSIPAAKQVAEPVVSRLDLSSSVTPVTGNGTPSPFFEIPRSKAQPASFTFP